MASAILTGVFEPAVSGVSSLRVDDDKAAECIAISIFAASIVGVYA